MRGCSTGHLTGNISVKIAAIRRYLSTTSANRNAAVLFSCSRFLSSLARRTANRPSIALPMTEAAWLRRCKMNRLQKMCFRSARCINIAAWICFFSRRNFATNRLVKRCINAAAWYFNCSFRIISSNFRRFSSSRPCLPRYMVWSFVDANRWARCT